MYLYIILFYIQPHKCHYGACPPCRLDCGEELFCGHNCKERSGENKLISKSFSLLFAIIYSILCTLFYLSWNVIIMFRCHGPIPPPNPEFTIKPKKKKTGRTIEATPGSACPPCKEIVLVSCLGQHLGQERQVWLCNTCFSTYSIVALGAIEEHCVDYRL
jgi:NF-X1-type zinc finger protein NFXL1